jgi:hypothetical protein
MLPIILAFYYTQITSGNINQAILTDFISTEAVISGVDPQVALSISKSESHLNPNAVGDHGTSFGMWQIHLPAHQDISKEQAENIIFSTEWSMSQLKEGNCQIWSTCPIPIKVE